MKRDTDRGIYSFWLKNTNCFMGEGNLGQVSWVSHRKRSCSLSLFVALHYLPSADDFLDFEVFKILCAARAASGLLYMCG